MSGVRPPSAGGDPPTWSERWIADLRATLADAPRQERSAVTARLATLLLASLRDDEADALLIAARRDAALANDPRELAAVEIALAAAALARDDDATAEARLAQARLLVPHLPPSLAARAWIVEARRARLLGVQPPAAPGDVTPTPDDPLEPDESTDLSAELALEKAVLAREIASLDEAHGALSLAHAAVEQSASCRLVAIYELEAAAFAALAGDIEHARARFRGAIERFREAGLRRDEGRAMIRFAETIAAHGGGEPGDTAPSWLGRAQQVLGGAATWRDRLSIRTGFRSFGRRAFDRVMTEGTVTRIEAFERARGALVNSLGNVVHATDRAVTDLETSAVARDTAAALSPRLERVRLAAREQASVAMQSVGELDASMRDLVELIGAALFERDRLRVLLNLLAEVDKAGEEGSLPMVVASLAAPLLDADRVVVAVERGGALFAAGEAGRALPGAQDDWRQMAEDAARRPSIRPSDPARLSPRSGETLCGPRIAIPIRGPDSKGVLYADKLRRQGQFREQDEAIGHLLAEYVALALGRLRAREKERFAHHQLAVTLDTIRDGVLACDALGVVASCNAAAARMLHVSQEELRGSQLASIGALAPLWSMLAVTPRVDGAVVRLPHGSFVVTARPISGGEADRGFVATLVELDRAQKIAQRLSATRARYGFHDVVGTSPSMQAAIAVARRAATIDANVLVTGESGTGKEVIAQAIHTAGPRANEPFIGVNCAAMPRDLLEAELFGYEKGAFTGARTEGNAGKFELAAGGTILLDEIGDMPLDMQAKLLRVLQERVVTRLGGRGEVPVHARVIATTHRDLAQLVDDGKFRMDLFYRLRVLAFELPPLRDRPEDIPVLARHYLSRFAEQQRKRAREIGPRVLDELGRYDWPGNVRELANVIEAEVSLAPPDIDVIERLATRLVGRFRTSTNPASTGEWRALPTSPGVEQSILQLAEVEKRAILHAIERCAGSVSKAADALGVSKVTIYAKLRAWGMHPRDRNEDSGEGPASGRWSSPRLPLVDDSAPSSGSGPVAPSVSPAPPSQKRVPGKG